MEKMEKTFTWIRQIIVNINVTADYAVDLIFSPIYSLIDFIEAVIIQWTTNPLQDEEKAKNNGTKHIGFNR